MAVLGRDANHWLGGGWLWHTTACGQELRGASASAAGTDGSVQMALES